MAAPLKASSLNSRQDAIIRYSGWRQALYRNCCVDGSHFNEEVDDLELPLAHAYWKHLLTFKTNIIRSALTGLIV